MMNQQRWHNLMDVWHMPSNDETYHALVKAHAEKHRYYHTSEHINACLRHLDQVKDLAKRPHHIELALWFHDAIYQPYRKDNELKSAQWSQVFLLGNNVDVKIVDEIVHLIMVTLHTDGAVKPMTADQSLMVDIDLSILGSRSEVYEVYERNVRREYRLVPYFLYRKKRKEVLQSFLDAPRIYQTDHFYHLLEKSARKNLKAWL